MPLLRLLLVNLTALACIGAAAVLAYEGKDGWGWFLFAALLFGSTSLATRDGRAKDEG